MMIYKFLHSTFLFFALYIVTCAQKPSSTFDPKEELDFNHSSILIEETITVKEVTAKVTDTWMGNYNWLNTNNKKGTYILIIKHDREEFFTITQKTMRGKKQLNTQIVKVILFLIDHKSYVFETEDGKLIPLNYLSDSQLKLGEYIFVRQRTK